MPPAACGRWGRGLIFCQLYPPPSIALYPATTLIQLILFKEETCKRYQAISNISQECSKKCLFGGFSWNHGIYPVTLKNQSYIQPQTEKQILNTCHGK